jgi:hypothetical protein
MTLEIIKPFICCPTCAQRIPLRIDGQPTFHAWPDGRICAYSWPATVVGFA